jgi:PD-(D/E)XK nuclease superfamily protein
MAAIPSDSPRPWTRDRFYTIEGRRLPSVTTILDVIAKPALGPWYAKQERRYFEAAMLEVLSKPGARDPEYVLSAVVDAVGGVKAADREKQRAATIGTAIHAGIEWQLRTRLGEDAGPEPVLPDAAAWAVESWKDWAKTIALEPLAIERTVYCEACGYAGTLDLYARVEGALTVLDWKSGRAIYPEAFLQNVAYRHAAKRQGLPSSQGLIVRVPKLVDDPSWEVMAVPETLGVDDFLAAARLWRWQRRMEGRPVGDLHSRRSGNEQDESKQLAAALR